MKAQLSIEFLLVFLMAVMFVYLVSSALLSAREDALLMEDDLRQVNRADETARAVEAWSNSGMDMGFSLRDEGFSFRVHEERLLVSHEGRVIEVGGVYSGSRMEAE